jgi:hypothetical protein
VPVWIILYFGTVIVAAFHPGSRERCRYLIAFAMTIAVVGTAMAAALSSVGPIFYDRILGGQRFDDLSYALQQNEASQLLLRISDRLYLAYLSGPQNYLAGISAMPSVHVAISVLNALFLSSINRWFGVAGWCFAAIIMFGSVYFGWHYALDGYVSIAAAVLIWRQAGRWTASLS